MEWVWVALTGYERRTYRIGILFLFCRLYEIETRIVLIISILSYKSWIKIGGKENNFSSDKKKKEKETRVRKRKPSIFSIIDIILKSFRSKIADLIKLWGKLFSSHAGPVLFFRHSVSLVLFFIDDWVCDSKGFPWCFWHFYWFL